MIQAATGLVLRTRPLTETSLIVHWLTGPLGRISTVAKGARRPKSPFAGKLDLFYLANFNFSRSPRSELHTLREVSLLETHGFLRHDLGCLRQASYCAALVEQATETETPLPNIFELMRQFLAGLLANAPQPQNVFGFELKLVNELGLTPDLENSDLTAGARQLVKLLGQSDWTGFSKLRLSAEQTRELRQFLHGFLIFHLGKIPISRAAALNAVTGKPSL